MPDQREPIGWVWQLLLTGVGGAGVFVLIVLFSSTHNLPAIGAGTLLVAFTIFAISASLWTPPADGPVPPVVTAPVPLAPLAALRTTVARLRETRLVLLRATFLPAAFVALTHVLGRLTYAGHWPYFEDSSFRILFPLVGGLTSGVAGALIAVSTHRIVLLGYNSLPTRWGLYWGWREQAFFGRVFAIGCISCLPYFAIAFIHGPEWDTYGKSARYAAWLLLGYPVSRLSLVLPSVATNQPISFSGAWRLSKGNGWRLWLVLLTGPVVLNLVGRGITALHLPDQVDIVTFIRSFALCLLGIFEIAALSVSFRTLRPLPSN